MFGPYELQALLGVGGMGEVYRAYDTAKDRTVAVKLLRPEMSADPGFQARFRRESRIAARLQEPHVIPVHDFGEINGVLYIDMRLVEGHDVHAELNRNGPLDPARAASIVGQVAAALDAAHASGLVHRDVKPENVLLTKNDFAYLVDFGIAYVGSETGLTSAGAAIGSCAYMAPERFTGGQVGPAADIYSLACLLYECLTGSAPFPTGELSQLMGAHIMSPPPRPSQTGPRVSAAFDAVVTRGMAKQPEQRFATAGDLARAANAAALAAQVSTEPSPEVEETQTTYRIPATPPPQSPPARTGFGRVGWLLAVAAGVLIVAIGLVLWFGLGKNKSEPVPVPTTATAGATTTQPTPTPTSAAPVALPGTDGQGFIDYPGARCDAGTSPAALARTTQSVLVVCRAGPGDFYYRGVRLSDSAGIELANAVRSSGGFDVTNPTDGTRYQIRPDSLTIMPPDGQPITEPMVEYASS
ncbi:serine/threonine protein kinase [Mycolicibacterium moriokaense]|uniref:non-specific serine/threonine protein kinase n=2 Tax=Mycolicibacterium moriokaense TaxID=39691 RepID=A0A318HCN5_9MYCO|nr:serine/threonine protein kinase [Mycolicibacterium moriokaense]